MKTREYLGHIITEKTITVVFDDYTPITVTKNDVNKHRFSEIIDVINRKEFDKVGPLIDRATNIETKTCGKFIVVGGVILIDGEPLPDSLSDKLIKLMDENKDTSYLENFWDNLKHNPTESSVRDLYSFLEVNDVPITKDGCFIVYKKVGDDYWDSHTGRTFRNTPGSVISMPRDKVDPNRNNTCSSGLHVAAFEYADNFFGRILLECKVNPKDVVAVPPDYSQQKMRVCRYQVLRETTTKFDESTYSETNPTNKLDGGEFRPLSINVDKYGRLRIPGVAIRRLGVGAGRKIVAAVPSLNCGYILLGAKDNFNSDKAMNYREYTVKKDNSIRLSTSISSLAGIALIHDSPEYIISEGPTSKSIKIETV